MTTMTLWMRLLVHLGWRSPCCGARLDEDNRWGRAYCVCCHGRVR